MKLILEVSSQHWQVNLLAARSLAIPLEFNGEQPNHFAAQQATAKPLTVEGFTGDLEQGGSCNVSVLSLVPHCNGTHTESLAHITHSALAPHQCVPNALLLATLISLSPISAIKTQDHYHPPLDAQDQVISKQQLIDQLKGVTKPFLEALIIRTYPNELHKKNALYNEQNPPAFFTNEAIDYLVSLGVQHLLVDMPSIDKMHDQGLLSNHHRFWQITPQSHHASASSHHHHTISELLYIENDIKDGQYLLNLQIAALNSDAAPSRPILYPLEPLPTELL